MGDSFFSWLLTGAGLIPVLLILLFVGVLVYGAWDALRAVPGELLFSTNWDPGNEEAPHFGGLPFIFGTLVTSILALLISAPVGIGVAAFLNEILPAKPRAIIAFLLEILATIPSVVYGMWGVFVLVPFAQGHLKPLLVNTLGRFIPLFSEPTVDMGQSLFAAVLVLSIMVLPIIVSISLDAIRSVPDTYREAALALGATRWETIRVAVLPAARSGLVGALILALGRALGETMAVTLVIGDSPTVRMSLFASGSTITSQLANKFGEAEAGSLTLSTLMALALVLFLMTLGVNLLARWIISRMTLEGGHHT